MLHAERYWWKCGYLTQELRCDGEDVIQRKKISARQKMHHMTHHLVFDGWIFTSCITTSSISKSSTMRCPGSGRDSQVFSSSFVPDFLPVQQSRQQPHNKDFLLDFCGSSSTRKISEGGWTATASSKESGAVEGSGTNAGSGANKGSGGDGACGANEGSRLIESLEGGDSAKFAASPSSVSAITREHNLGFKI